MRLRNIPGAREVIAGHEAVIKNEKEQKGHWEEVFGNDHPVRVEIGMGKGRFLMTMALEHPEINYIGIERYSSVLLRALERMDAMEEPPSNIRFVCMDAAEIEEVFEPGEVDRIYLNFSDPWPKARHARRRLTSTDNKELFEFSLEQVQEAGWELKAHTFDLHHNEDMNRGNIMTEYEAKFSAKGNPICKLIAGRKREA